MKQSNQKNEFKTAIQTELEAITNTAANSYERYAKNSNSIDTILKRVKKDIEKHEDSFQEVYQEQLFNAYLQGLEQTQEQIQNKQKTAVTDMAVTAIELPQFYHPEVEASMKGIFSKIRDKLKNWKEYWAQEKQKIKDKYKIDIDKNPQLYQEVINWLDNKTFKGSKKIFEKITDKIFTIIRRESEEKGKGPRDVAREIRKEFTELTKNESERIARTEIIQAYGKSTYDELMADETVEYIQWIATEDERTRDSHAEQHLMIVRAGDPFPNGCYYPGDDSADPSEFINCRCAIEAFYPDAGYVPPVGADYWFEEDMVFGGSDDLKRQLDEISNGLFG